MSVPISNIINYNTQLINLLSERKEELKNNRSTVESFKNHIANIIRTNLPNIGDVSLYLNSDFYLKSYYNQTFNMTDYIPSNEGELIKTSSNCVFTIGDCNFDGINKRIFTKLVKYYDSYDEEIETGETILFFEIIVNIIFNYLMSLPENEKFKDHITPMLNYGLILYKNGIKENSKGNLNYNELNYKNAEFSPYHPNIITRYTRSNYNKKARILITEAINSPLSIYEIFNMYMKEPDVENHQLLLRDVIRNSADLFEFIKHFGVNYGFVHRDLHSGNILYNHITKKLVLIDFGSSYFAKFVTTRNKTIDDNVDTAYNLLNYNMTFKDIGFPIRTPSVDLYLNMPFYFNYQSGIAGDKYFNVIFDLITYSLDIYIKTIYYIYNLLNENYDTFIENFSKIIKITPDGGDINNLLKYRYTFNTGGDMETLIDNYNDILDDYISTIEYESTKKHYKFLLEGLLYAALLINQRTYKRPIPVSGAHIRSNIIFETTLVVKRFDYTEFQFQLLDDVMSLHGDKLTNLSFLRNFIPIKRGGRGVTKSMSIQRDFNSRKSMSIQKDFKHFNSPKSNYDLFALKKELRPKYVTLEETSKAYENLYLAKTEIDILNKK